MGEELAAQWPPLVQGLHRLSFDDERVRLHLAFGDAARWVPQWVARVDAFFLDGFAPDRNPAMWDERLLKALARLAAPGSTASTWSAARRVRDGLTSAGFTVNKSPGRGGKREITTARFEPPATRRAAPPGRRVGAEPPLVDEPGHEHAHRRLGEPDGVGQIGPGAARARLHRPHDRHPIDPLQQALVAGHGCLPCQSPRRGSLLRVRLRTRIVE